MSTLTRRGSRFGGIALGFSLGVASTLVGVSVLGSSSVTARQQPQLDRDAFDRAIDQVLDRYVDPLDESEVLARGLKHVVEGLDPHSHFYTADERRALASAHRRGGTGLVAMLGEDGQAEIIAVDPDSPASELGLRSGDTILRIGTRDVGEIDSQAELEASMRGPTGDAIKVEVQRRFSPEPETVALTFRKQTAPVVSTHLEGTVGIARVRSFRAGTGEQVLRAVDKLRRASGFALKGLVLDLRSNPGGEVDEALIVADHFLDQGVLTRTRGRGGRILREEKAHAAGADTETPLVILQDRHTASAAELLTAALKDNGRATVVGERSYGKGTVQQLIGLDDGSMLALTVARYTSPSDRVIDKTGVAPDVRVTLTGTDADRRHAVAALGERDGSRDR